MSLAQETTELVNIETVTADHRAVQQQDGNIEAVAALQDGIAIDVNDLDGRQRGPAAERLQLAQHFVAELTVVTMDDSELAMGQGRESRAKRV